MLSGKDIEYRICLKGVHMSPTNPPPGYGSANMAEVDCQGLHLTHTQLMCTSRSVISAPINRWHVKLIPKLKGTANWNRKVYYTLGGA